MCFVLPAQFDKFTGYIAASHVESYWMIKTLDRKQTAGVFLSSKNQAELNRYAAPTQIYAHTLSYNWE